MTGHWTTKWSNRTFLLIIASAYFVLKWNAFRARSQQRNAKSCQKPCLPWWCAGPMVLVITHPCSSLHWGHHGCPFKVRVCLSPSCLGTCLTFSLEAVKCALLHSKIIFQRAQRGALAKWCTHLLLSTVNVFEGPLPVPERVVGLCPVVPCGPAPALQLPPTCLRFLPRESKLWAKKKYLCTNLILT